MVKTKKSSKFYLALVIFSLVGQIAWVMENMYFNVFIYKMFNASADAISGMVAASAIAATVTTLLIGALSDKVGKRKIFICGGYIAWGISILSFSLIRIDVISALFPLASAASVGVSLTIIMDCVMTFFGSSANDACFNAWLTDVTDDSNRGAVEGINSMMPLLAILVVFGGFMGFDLGKSESWTTVFLIIGSVVLILGIAGLALALLCGCCGCASVPLVVSIVGLVLGIIAFKKAKDAGAENKMALVALILSAAGCLVSLIGIILGSILPTILAGMGVDLMGMDMLEDMMYMLR